MNNEQFRKLVLPSANKLSDETAGSSQSTRTNAGDRLGSRQRASITRTPRSGGNTQADFARQFAERNRALNPLKRHKSFAPKGSKLADGYTDRSKTREDSAQDDKESRLKALDESFKKEEIDHETYEKLRSQIAGGDLSSTHLVKGLDFQLLKKIREGHDVYKTTKVEEEEGEEDEEGEEEDDGAKQPPGSPTIGKDVDDEFDELETQEVHAIEKEKAEKKKGILSKVNLAPGKKRTRDQILAELRAAREAAKAQQQSKLGGRFSRIGAKRAPGTRIERDGKGREVMIITDENGNEKRKVRKVQDGETATTSDMMMPDPNAKPLGMDVPEHYRKMAEPEEIGDVDIFADVGDDYDPLAGLDGSESESESDPDDDKSARQAQVDGKTTETGEELPLPPQPLPREARHNYFKDSKAGLISEQESVKAPSMSDPAIMAAIKRAAALDPLGGGMEEDDDDEEQKRKKAAEDRRKKMLESSNRDEEDMDMGFGTSRFEDEADFDETKVKLSKWGADDDDDDGRQGSKGGSGKRKRGSKKRKGDVNNAEDVLRVMEQRKNKS